VYRNDVVVKSGGGYKKGDMGRVNRKEIVVCLLFTKNERRKQRYPLLWFGFHRNPSFIHPSASTNMLSSLLF